jgi:hypothetical protein
MQKNNNNSKDSDKKRTLTSATCSYKADLPESILKLWLLPKVSRAERVEGVEEQWRPTFGARLFPLQSIATIPDLTLLP